MDREQYETAFGASKAQIVVHERVICGEKLRWTSTDI